MRFTYYFETYDPALNAVSWSAYNKSDCTPDSQVAVGDVHVNVEWCDVCVKYGSGTYGYSSKVTGCPMPVTKKLPTSIEPDSTVSVVSFHKPMTPPLRPYTLLNARAEVPRRLLDFILLLSSSSRLLFFISPFSVHLPRCADL